MEQEEIKNLILERFSNLQPEIQNIILDENYDIKLLEIGKKFNLSKEQTENLEFNTTLVLLGNTHPDEYKNEIMADLIIDEALADQIVNDVNQTILRNVSDTIKQNFIDDNLAEKELEKFISSTTKETTNDKIITTNNIPIPLPPYKDEKVENKVEIPTPPTVNSVGDNHLEEEEHRILSDSGIDIIGSKLANPTVSAPKTSDYSLPKVNSQKEASRIDPYREDTSSK